MTTRRIALGIALVAALCAGWTPLRGAPTSTETHVEASEPAAAEPIPDEAVRADELPSDHPALRVAIDGRLPANVGIAVPAGDDFEGGVDADAQLDGIPHLLLDEQRRTLAASLGREPTRDEILHTIAADDERVAALNDQLAARGAEFRELHARGDVAGMQALERELVDRFYREPAR